MKAFETSATHLNWITLSWIAKAPEVPERTGEGIPFTAETVDKTVDQTDYNLSTVGKVQEEK